MLQGNNVKLSILIPVYNEIRYLDKFTTELRASFKDEDVEYIFINDGSTDGSSNWLEEYINNINDSKYKLINYKSNRGKGSALQEGLKVCKGDYILFQDSDLELDTKDSYEMYSLLQNNKKIKCVFGTRYMSGKIKKNNNFFNALIGKINSIIFNLLFFQSISDLHCGTKIISKEVKEKINLSINDFGFEIDLATQISKNNFEIFEYGISYFARTKDEGKKITWIDGLKSYFYFFKTRFIDNNLSVQFSIMLTVLYMIYVGSHFGMGIGNILSMTLFSFVGLFVGLHRKIAPSLFIYLFIYLGSLFSKGNGKIATVLIFFIIGLYLSKKFADIIKKHSNNKKINFFV